jgi:sugar diacid utilization regulator
LDAVEAGSGLPEAARAAARGLEASLVIVDDSEKVLASACRSPEEERALLSGHDTEVVALRVGESVLGELRLRRRSQIAPAAIRMAATLIALEVDRARAPERATEVAVSDLLSDLLGGKTTDRQDIIARTKELGADLTHGASVLIARAHPRQPKEGNWRAQVLALVERGARAITKDCLAGACVFATSSHRRSATVERAGGIAGELVVLLGGSDEASAQRVCASVRRELEINLTGYSFAVGRSRPVADPADIRRAGAEALLAVNVAAAQDVCELSYEDTGTYRLLLPVMSEDPDELRRFHDETVAPLLSYDAQYDTELARTLEEFLDSDANVAKTAQKLFTHRHTVRYRLERVRELTGLDVASTEGRERLGLGLKAMRVLGIPPFQGPSTEPRANTGRGPRDDPKPR